MKIEVGGFRVKNEERLEMSYMVGVKLDTSRPKSNWIIVEFEDPKNKNFTKKIFKIKSNQEKFLFYSDSVCGLRDYQAYLVKVSLSADDKGSNIVDSLEQYIRVSHMGLAMKKFNYFR